MLQITYLFDLFICCTVTCVVAIVYSCFTHGGTRWADGACVLYVNVEGISCCDGIVKITSTVPIPAVTNCAGICIPSATDIASWLEMIAVMSTEIITTENRIKKFPKPVTTPQYENDSNHV
jgi:hypothetical protein